jgi:2-oxoglutarate dehydrogenase E1 component
MAIDFEKDYGVNAGYVQSLFEDWQRAPEDVEEIWRRVFERVAEPAPERPAAPLDEELEPLTGIAGRIAANMEQSLELPVATSARTMSAKVLSENRALLNEHLQVRAYKKTSFTHLVAFALVRALAEQPRVQCAHEEVAGKAYRRVPRHVNLGLAIDVPGPKGRMLVVPSIKQAETLDFLAFYEAFDDIVRRGRDGQLASADFAGTTCTLTNPGGFGTSMSVPRLMQGQGLIIATGSIGVPPEMAGMSASRLAELALGPVMTCTSTYDHRVVQGAESGLLLQRLDQLLQGADAFYDDIFAAFRVPWTPARLAADNHVEGDESHQVRIWQLVSAYRSRGHRIADLDPLGYQPAARLSLDPSTYGFTVWDLDRVFLAGGLGGEERMTLREILATLRRAYCRRWTIEYMHITERQRKHWIRARVEEQEHAFEFDGEHRKRILGLLSRAENFEHFLAARYVGNKRFSLEGGDTLIPALAEVLDRAAHHGVRTVVIGMAHRGRLNVLANIMGKSYRDIFREFEAVLLPLSLEGSGDVKYHLGQRGSYTTRDGREVEVVLSANPSHLEAVDPIVCGMTRALQDASGDHERRAVLAVLIHGDAAFAGQGVVSETFNMSELRAYGNGGTVHIVVNNQIGFTASPRDLLSTHFCTDVAKGVEAPVLHANGDFPEAVLRAARVAVDYRQEFGADAVIDMVCYRRWGHNEGDEPAYTQPLLYARIAKHPSVRENYTRLLLRRGALTEDDAAAISADYDAELRTALAEQQAAPRPELPDDEVLDLDLDDPADYAEGASPETGVPAGRLVELVDALDAVPSGFVTHPNLLRQLARRERMVRGEQGLDWGCAEALAFGTLLREGVPIRLSGQDSGRGTFSHRHAVMRDQVTEAEHVPLAALGGASFEVWDSLLSEEAVLGFEYGYSVARPEALVFWEAQFGDFVNGAQIQIDQFIVSGQAKWRQQAGLVMLLPHGFDGMGPEHSSARPERFLTACSGGNLTVANCTTSAQHFHLVRRQGLAGEKRPLVVLTPKALLRDRRAASPIEDFTQGGFREVIADDVAAARRVLLCTGKVYYDLVAWREEHAVQDVAIVRVEQLYPFPRAAILAALEHSGAGETVWVQEEPRNMGAWPFVLQRFVDLGRPIAYAGRPEASSPASGSHSRHLAEQRMVLQRAFA